MCIEDEAWQGLGELVTRIVRAAGSIGGESDTAGAAACSSAFCNARIGGLAAGTVAQGVRGTDRAGQPTIAEAEGLLLIASREFGKNGPASSSDVAAADDHGRPELGSTGINVQTGIPRTGGGVLGLPTGNRPAATAHPLHVRAWVRS